MTYHVVRMKLHEITMKCGCLEDPGSMPRSFWSLPGTSNDAIAGAGAGTVWARSVFWAQRSAMLGAVLGAWHSAPTCMEPFFGT